MQRLIIIRGNSGSGKSVVAKKLRTRMGDQTMLIPQDVVRREVLGVKDYDGNPTPQLLYDMALYGKSIGFDVIIEGILQKKTYGDMLQKLIQDFGGNASIYYFDIPFEETLKRHDTKSNKDEFGEGDMRRWWNEKDYLDVAGEQTINEHMSEDEIVEMMYDNGLIHG